MLRLLGTFFLLVLAKAGYTTTLGTLAQKSAAIISAEAFLSDAIVDIANDYSKYASYMDENSMTYPQTLLQFYVGLGTITDDSFPTSYLVDNFPITQFYTFITNFPWYTSLLSEVDATTFYLPEHFATITSTVSSSSTSTSTSTGSSPGPSHSSSSSSSSSSTFTNSTDAACQLYSFLTAVNGTYVNGTFANCTMTSTDTTTLKDTLTATATVTYTTTESSVSSAMGAMGPAVLIPFSFLSLGCLLLW